MILWMYAGALLAHATVTGSATSAHWIPPQLEARAHPRFDTSEALKEFAALKLKQGRSPRYVKHISAFIEGWISGRDFRQISRQDVQRWVDGHEGKPNTIRTRLGHLQSFFTFLERREHIQKSPSDNIEFGMKAEMCPRVLTVDECKELLRICPNRLLGYFAVGLFCALRPDEARQLKSESIDLEAKTIRIEAVTSKVRRRRVVPVSDCAVPFLRDWKPVTAWMIADGCRETATAMGWDHWPKDVLRHTAISMLVAKFEDIGKVATWAGNSVSIIQRHYLQLVSRAEADRFFSL